MGSIKEGITGIKQIFEGGQEISCVYEGATKIWCKQQVTIVRNSIPVPIDFIMLSSNEPDLNTLGINLGNLFTITGNSANEQVLFAFDMTGNPGVKLDANGTLHGATPPAPGNPATSFGYRVRCSVGNVSAISETISVWIVPYATHWSFQVTAINGNYNNAWQYPTIVEMGMHRSRNEGRQFTWGTDVVSSSGYYPPHNGAKIVDGRIDSVHSWIGNQWLQGSSLYVTFNTGRKAITVLKISAASDAAQLQRDRYPTQMLLWYKLRGSGAWIYYGAMSSVGAWRNSEVRTFTF